ncbi:Glycosyltransferase 1 domain-containing protein 1 [Pteropus alecto]|uniref:Glycosyltransferase 1 domain-containing protein 1 n=1 Tax=Pteropus alecto TaxID=9402 RepID=L5KTI3_PTEAL|nr:Glycosyltransferase 1 domain-containing protein 1 [Pteropus alecto]
MPSADRPELSRAWASLSPANVMDHLEAAGHACVLRDASDFDSQPDVADFIQAVGAEAALALHLYRGGRLLREAEFTVDIGRGHAPGGVPAGADSSGGEAEGDGGRPKKAAVTPSADATGLGIVTAPNAAFDWNTFLRRAEIRRSADEARVFLLVCGLRQVKDPLYLVDAFSAWHQEEPSVYMVIVGPEVQRRGTGRLVNVNLDLLQEGRTTQHTWCFRPVERDAAGTPPRLHGAPVLGLHGVLPENGYPRFRLHFAPAGRGKRVRVEGPPELAASLTAPRRAECHSAQLRVSSVLKCFLV